MADKIIGQIYIKSNLSLVEQYLFNRIVTATIIISCIIAFSYLLALRLQGVIHNPILNLIQDTQSISSSDNYSIRVQKLYADEIGTIVDSFNKILDEREQQDKKYTDKSQQLIDLSNTSKAVIEHLNREFKIPFQAANSFKDILERQAFGEINPIYLEYYNDLYLADMDLYYTINKIMELNKLQSSIFSAQNNYQTILQTIEFIQEKYINKHNLHKVSLLFNCQNINSDQLIKPHISHFLDNIIFIFFANTHTPNRYEVSIAFSQCHIRVGLVNKDKKPQHINDNFNNLPLDKLVNHIKNLEQSWDAKDILIVDFDNMVTRGKINMLNFLSSIYQSTVTCSLSTNKVAFELEFAEDICVNRDTKELAN